MREINNWNSLPLKEKATYIKIGVANGIYNIKDIQKAYKSFATGGNLFQTGGSTDDKDEETEKAYEKYLDSYTNPNNAAVMGQGPFAVPKERIDDYGNIIGGILPEVTVIGHQDRGARIREAISKGMNPIEAFRTQVYNVMPEWEKQGFPDELSYRAANGDAYAQMWKTLSEDKPLEIASPEFYALTLGAGAASRAIQRSVAAAGSAARHGATMARNGIRTGLGYLAPGATTIRGLMASPFVGDVILGTAAGGIVNEVTKPFLDGGIDSQWGGLGSLVNPGYYMSGAGLSKGIRAIEAIEDQVGNFVNKKFVKPFKKWNNLDERLKRFQQSMSSYDNYIQALPNKGITIVDNATVMPNLGESLYDGAANELRRVGFTESSPGVYTKNNLTQQEHVGDFTNPLTGESNPIYKENAYQDNVIASIDINGIKSASGELGIAVPNNRLAAFPKENMTYIKVTGEKAQTRISSRNTGLTDMSINNPARSSMRSYLTSTRKAINTQVSEDVGFTGSTLLAEKGLIAKSPGDMEVFALRKDMDKLQQYFGAKGEYVDNGFGVAKVTTDRTPNKGKAKQAVNGDYDIDIVETVGDDPDGAAVGKLAHQIYASLHPVEYRQLVQKATDDAIAKGIFNMDSFGLQLPVSGKQLLAEYNSGNNAIKCQIQNYISSSKEKHAENLNSILTNSEYAPLIKESIIDKGRAMIKDYQGFQTSYPEVRFDDVEANKIFLKGMGFSTKYANNPEIVANIAEKAHLDMVHTRCVDPAETGIDMFANLLTNTASKRIAGAGGNNTFGDAGGGLSYGKLTGAIQRNFHSSDVRTPADFVKLNKKIDKQLRVPFTEEEKEITVQILKKYGLSGTPTNIEQLDDIISAATGTHGFNGVQTIVDNSLMTYELAEALHIPGAIGYPYSSSNASLGRYFGSYNKPTAYGYSLNNGKLSPFENGVRTIEFNSTRHQAPDADIEKLFNNINESIGTSAYYTFEELERSVVDPEFVDYFTPKSLAYVIGFPGKKNNYGVGVDPKYNAMHMYTKAASALDARKLYGKYAKRAAVGVPLAGGSIYGTYYMVDRQNKQKNEKAQNSNKDSKK